MIPRARCHAAAMGTAALLLSFLSTSIRAGGSPENVVLIIDPTDATSLYVGNYYKNSRDIPDSNVLYLRSGSSSYSTFTTTVTVGFSGSLAERNILDHIDYVVLAPLGSYAMPAAGEFNSSYKNISITTAYELIPLSSPEALTNLSNPYGAAPTPGYPSGDPAVSFHAQQAYRFGVPSTDGLAGNQFISALLGYTRGPVGNTVTQILAMIDRSVASDGARPAGTFYFMNNLSDNARNVRACGSTSGCGSNPRVYTATAAELAAIGATGTVANGVVPNAGTTHIAGLMTGFANYDLANANLGFVPGAFADHLTSFGGVLDGSQPQTTVESWIAAGASGSAGSIEEPGPNVAKFPSPDFHYYYSQGMSLGEAYLHSVELLPLEMVLYGDPLARPFAYLPSVSVAIPSGIQSGIITITPSATTGKPGAAIARFSLLVDGINMATVVPGQSFSLDTQALDDGRHDLRVLAYDNSPVESVGRWAGTLDTANFGHSSTLSVAPASGTLVQPFMFSYSAGGGHVLEAHLVQNGRVLAASTAASGTLTVYGQNLGAGRSNIRLEVWYDDGRAATSIPVTVNVLYSGTPAGVAPVAYSYSKYLTTPLAYLVELPASYDAAPGSLTYTVLNTPTQATLIQSNTGGPYVIVKPRSGAFGSEVLQFRVTASDGSMSTAAVTLVYTRMTIISGLTPTANVMPCCWNGTHSVGVQFTGANRAGTWNGTADSWADLTPPGAVSSVAYAANGGQIVGSATVGPIVRGGYWTGGADSWVDLTLPGSVNTVVAGVYVNPIDNLAQGQQVGYACTQPSEGCRALIWFGTAGSVVDVTPNVGTTTGLIGTDGTYQVGFVMINGAAHTGFWKGTADSWVDVHPADATESWPYAMDGNPPYESVGYALFNDAQHAGYWVSEYGGAAGSWVDLNPSSASGSAAIGTDADFQVGWAMLNGVTHASLWNGTAGSWIDLTRYVPAAYTLTGSYAAAVAHDEKGTYVLGQAQTAARTMAVIWKSP